MENGKLKGERECMRRLKLGEFQRAEGEVREKEAKVK